MIAKNEKNDYYWTLKGELLDAKKRYDSAIYFYNYALVLDPNSGAKISRALTYIKIGEFNKAIADYRSAYEGNYDFSYNLATTFELNNQKDSALMYYKIYLEHYPDSLVKQLNIQGVTLSHSIDTVQSRIKRLRQN